MQDDFCALKFTTGNVIHEKNLLKNRFPPGVYFLYPLIRNQIFTTSLFQLDKYHLSLIQKKKQCWAHIFGRSASVRSALLYIELTGIQFMLSWRISGIELFSIQLVMTVGYKRPIDLFQHINSVEWFCSKDKWVSHHQHLGYLHKPHNCIHKYLCHKAK